MLTRIVTGDPRIAQRASADRDLARGRPGSHSWSQSLELRQDSCLSKCGNVRVALEEDIINAIMNSHCKNPPIVMRSTSPPMGLWVATLKAANPPERNTAATDMKEGHLSAWCEQRMVLLLIAVKRVRRQTSYSLVWQRLLPCLRSKEHDSS
jgi:hypothetical protein